MVAVMLGPLHNRISDWAEDRFQRDLSILKKELPDLLLALSSGNTVRHFGAIVLPKIQSAVHSMRIALWIDGAIVARHGSAKSSRRRLKRQLSFNTGALLAHVDDADFPLRIALRSPLGNLRCCLLLGPRPDGSFYGRDDLGALAAITPSLRDALFTVLARERNKHAFAKSVQRLTTRIANLEAELKVDNSTPTRADA